MPSKLFGDRNPLRYNKTSPLNKVLALGRGLFYYGVVGGKPVTIKGNWNKSFAPSSFDKN